MSAPLSALTRDELRAIMAGIGLDEMSASQAGDVGRIAVALDEMLCAQGIAAAKTASNLAKLEDPLSGARIEGEGFGYVFADELDETDPVVYATGFNAGGYFTQTQILPTLKALVACGAATVFLPGEVA